MKTAVILSYKGIGANLLHLAYCHKIAKKFGPITIITLCQNLEEILSKDPLIKEIIYLDKYYKKFFDIFNLSNFLKKLQLENIFIFYPSFRYFIASKIAKINNIHCYPLFIKKNLHLVNAAKKFTEQSLKVENCSTETNLYVDKQKQKEAINKINQNKKNIMLGVGSSGPTTRWGSKNFINLIKKLDKKKYCFFFLLCGPNEKEIAQEIIKEIGIKKCSSLSNETISNIIPLISVCDIYIGNDSFGHHVASQCGIPCLIIMLDTPRAYSDYSINQYRIMSSEVNINNITHDSRIDPNMITVDQVYEKILFLLK